MLPNRTSTRIALAATGLATMTGALVGAQSSTTDSAAVQAPSAETAPAAQPERYVGPSPSNVARVAALTGTSPARQATPKPTPQLPQSVRSGAVPQVGFDAYRAAEQSMARTTPRCHIDWKLIAGIGRVESHHANLGDATADGRLKSPIYGPTLDGSLGGNQVVGDTDGGALDGDAAFDRAVGPMQFLPSTWKHFAADGNGDGKADPQNLFDAALTTARYLCDEGLDMRNPGDVTTAVLRYNNSTEYVADVVGHARSY